MIGWMIREQRDGLLHHLHREIIPAGLMRDESHEMQRIGMLWLHGQNLPIDGLRLPEERCAR